MRGRLARSTAPEAPRSVSRPRTARSWGSLMRAATVTHHRWRVGTTAGSGSGSVRVPAAATATASQGLTVQAWTAQRWTAISTGGSAAHATRMCAAASRNRAGPAPRPTRRWCHTTEQQPVLRVSPVRPSRSTPAPRTGGRCRMPARSRCRPRTRSHLGHRREARVRRSVGTVRSGRRTPGRWQSR